VGEQRLLEDLGFQVNVILILVILLLAGVIGVGIIIYRSYRRLQAHIAIMGTHLLSMEALIPKINSELGLLETYRQNINQALGWFTEHIHGPSLQHDELEFMSLELSQFKAAVDKLKNEVLTNSDSILKYIEVRDWGMASFFAVLIWKRAFSLRTIRVIKSQQKK
jgi:hypothetical protein